VLKERVHNQLEAEVLIKEAFSKGDEDKYHETKFYTHDGDYLFKCLITTTEYEMVWPNGDSTTKEL